MVEEFAKQSFSDRNNPVIGQDFSKFNFSDGNYPLGKWLIGNHIENNILDKTINLRLFGLFGEYEDFTRRFISNNVCRILSGLPISINKDMKFDYLYIKDFCAYLKKILYKKTWSSRTYNFCSGKPIRLTELAQIIKNLMGVEEMFTVNLQGENREYSGDPSKLINEFGALQTTPHERAIFEMIEFYKNQFAVKRNFKEDFIDSLLNARVVFSQQEKNRLKKH
jgi:dTDP-D-glucose 4,6-dehydratase